MSNKPKNITRNFVKPVKAYKHPKKPMRKGCHLRIIQEALIEKTKELVLKKYGNGGDDD